MKRRAGKLSVISYQSSVVSRQPTAFSYQPFLILTFRLLDVSTFLRSFGRFTASFDAAGHERTCPPPQIQPSPVRSAKNSPPIPTPGVFAVLEPWLGRFSHTVSTLLNSLLWTAFFSCIGFRNQLPLLCFLWGGPRRRKVEPFRLTVRLRSAVIRSREASGLRFSTGGREYSLLQSSATRSPCRSIAAM